MATSPTALKHYQLYLDGQFVDSSSKETGIVINPATEEPLATFPLATETDAAAVVLAAERAQTSWRQLPAPARG
jgi:lactaldehyde dehydrogenase/glycolaldehyde dehydrogenase